MTSLKREHIVLEDDPTGPAPSRGPAIHPDRQRHTAPSARAQAKAAKKAKKSVAKQRYLIKKANKKRKLDSARKAAAPKNKQWRAEDGGVGENKPTIAPELGNDDVEDAQGDPGRHGTASVVETEKDGFPRPAEAGPSSFMTGGQLESGGEGHDAADAVDENADRERRRRERRERQEKKEISASNKPKGEEDAAVEENPNALTHAVNGYRTRKETVKEIAMQGTELEQRRPERKEKLAKRKQKVERGTGIQNELDSSAVLAKSVEAAGGDINDAVSEEDERERRRREKKEKRANRDRTWKKNHVSSEDGQIGDQEAPDDRIGGGETIEQDLMTSPASPPPLEAFPLPRPAPAPDPRILARQGLPVGLTDATFVDQELRIPIHDIEYASQGVKEKGMSERMGKRLAEIGVEDFFAVQAAILPHLLPLRLIPSPYETLHDYLISAPTGSGKTLAYAIPIIEILSQRFVTRLRALIVLPTRDLVVQVRETMEALAKGTGLAIGCVTGQHSFSHEQGQLIADLKTPLFGGSSKLDILIATPGRLIDHLAQTPNFSLQHLRFLVIDEADRLLNQSFQNWLSQVLSHILPPSKPIELPPGVERLTHDLMTHAWQPRPWYEGSRPIPSPCQKLLFSATLTRDPQAIASLDLRHPKYFIVQSPSIEADATSFGENFALPTSLTEKMLILPPALKPLNLIHLLHHPEYKVKGALVFTKSVESAARLVKLLEYFEEAWMEEKVVIKGYTSEMKHVERKRLLGEFAQGTIHLLVCSDLIARGMDLPSVAHVISYDVPLDMRKYVHRVGRTARAGRAGTAWTLVEKQEASHFKGLLKAAGREKKVRKVKVKEEELAPYRASYEIAMGRLKEYYGRDG